DSSDMAASFFGTTLPLLTRTVALECVIALDPSFDRAYADLVSAYLEVGLYSPAMYARADAVLTQLKSHNPARLLGWEIGAELETDMARLADQCHAMIECGERMFPYVHPTGLQDVRGVYGKALAHLGLHREAFAYFAFVDRPQEPYLRSILNHAVGCL